MRTKSKDATQNYDCVIWSGDLNFRLDQSREDVVQWACNDQAFPADVPLILNGDQLRQVMEEGKFYFWCEWWVNVGQRFVDAILL